MEHINNLLGDLGYDTTNDHLKKTPKRSYNYFKEYTKKTDLDFIQFCSKNNIKSTQSNSSSQVNISISLDNISVHSICKHHLLPFYGNVYISYISKGFVLGLSKFKRIIDFLSKEFTTQEDLTYRIATYILKILPVKTLYVTLKCVHSCMIVRGIKDLNSTTTTKICLHERDEGIINEIMKDI
jgi:GTP cyclohydrolase IA